MTETPNIPDRRTMFADAIRTSFPGGKHIADHVHDGPWRALVCFVGESTKYNEINWLVEYVLDAYTSYDIVHYSENEAEDLKLVVVPDFGYELLYWHSDHESEFYVVDEHNDIAPFKTEPTEAQIIENLGGAYGEGISSETLKELATLTNLPGLTARLKPLLEANPLEDEIPGLFDALLAALRPTSTT